MNIQDKQPQTVYVPVSVDEKLPTKNGWYAVINPNALTENKSDCLWFNMYQECWFNENDDTEHPSHWLYPQQAVVLSAEEWEMVKKCIEILNEYVKEQEGESRPSYIEAKQALQQLNQQP